MQQRVLFLILVIKAFNISTSNKKKHVAVIFEYVIF